MGQASFNTSGKGKHIYKVTELIFHPNLEYLRTAAETPVLGDIRMVDTVVVFITIQAAGGICVYRRNSKMLQCAYMRKTVLVTRSFSAYIRKTSKISKLSQNENNSVYIRRNSKTLQSAYMRKTVLVTPSFSAYIRRNSKISKLSQNENNSAYIRRNSKTLQCAYMHKIVIAVRSVSAYMRKNSEIS